MTMDELAVIAIICRWLKPSVVFEFGTFNGRTTLNLAANTPAEAKICPVFPEQADGWRKPRSSRFAHCLSGNQFQRLNMT
jgi:hypothetical protein